MVHVLCTDDNPGSINESFRRATLFDADGECYEHKEPVELSLKFPQDLVGRLHLVCGAVGRANGDRDNPGLSPCSIVKQQVMVARFLGGH